MASGWRWPGSSWRSRRSLPDGRWPWPPQPLPSGRSCLLVYPAQTASNPSLQRFAAWLQSAMHAPTVLRSAGAVCRCPRPRPPSSPVPAKATGTPFPSGFATWGGASSPSRATRRPTVPLERRRQHPCFAGLVRSEADRAQGRATAGLAGRSQAACADQQRRHLTQGAGKGPGGSRINSPTTDIGVWQSMYNTNAHAPLVRACGFAQALSNALTGSTRWRARLMPRPSRRPVR